MAEENKNNPDSSENKPKDDEFDHELEKLRLKRMQQVLAMQKQQQAQKAQILTINQKIDTVLRVILQSDAYAYLKDIEKRDPTLYENIKSALMPPEFLNEIDLLLQYHAQGQLKYGVIPLIDIQYLERQILGIGPQITIKKRHEDAKSLNSFLKD